MILDILVGLGAVVGALALIFVVVVLKALVTMWVWNLALVPIVASAGGHIGKIGLGVAVLVNIAFEIIKNTVAPKPVAETKKP